MSKSWGSWRGGRRGRGDEYDTVGAGVRVDARLSKRSRGGYATVIACKRQRTGVCRRQGARNGCVGCVGDDVVGAEGAWSEVEEGPAGRPCSIPTGARPDLSAQQKHGSPFGFTGQRSPPARSDAPLHPARRIGSRKATWRQVEDP